MTRYNNAKVAAIALAALIALYGLASRTPERVAEAEVRGFLDEFFAARLSRDHRKAGEYLSDELREGQAAADPALLIGSSYLHYHTYRIEKVAPRGDGVWLARVTLSEETPGHGAVGWFSEELTVARGENGFRVTEIRRGEYHDGPP